MTGRQAWKKEVLDSLKERNLDAKDIDEMIMKKEDKSSEAARKLRTRFLQLFIDFGLVEEFWQNSRKYYRWYLQLASFKSGADRESKWQHSLILVNGLKVIGRLDFSREDTAGAPDPDLIMESARTHLGYYPIVQGLLNARDESAERLSNLETNLESFLTKELEGDFHDVPVLPASKFSGKEDFPCVNRKLAELMLYVVISSAKEKVIVDTNFQEDRTMNVRLASVVVARGKALQERVRKFQDRVAEDPDCSEIRGKALEARDESDRAALGLRREISKLILKIQAGEPLLGRCETCPEFYVETASQAKSP
jgi:hypothetical protein